MLPLIFKNSAAANASPDRLLNSRIRSFTWSISMATNLPRQMIVRYLRNMHKGMDAPITNSKAPTRDKRQYRGSRMWPRPFCCFRLSGATFFRPILDDDPGWPAPIPDIAVQTEPSPPSQMTAVTRRWNSTADLLERAIATTGLPGCATPFPSSTQAPGEPSFDCVYGPGPV